MSGAVKDSVHQYEIASNVPVVNRIHAQSSQSFRVRHVTQAYHQFGGPALWLLQHSLIFLQPWQAGLCGIFQMRSDVESVYFSKHAWFKFSKGSLQQPHLLIRGGVGLFAVLRPVQIVLDDDAQITFLTGSFKWLSVYSVFKLSTMIYRYDMTF